MQRMKRLLWAVLVLLLPVNANAQDPGIRDTVSIEGGPLIVGQSVPLRYRISNDEDIGGIVNGMTINSVDGGLIKFDSVVWVGRMEDPSVIDFRVANVAPADSISTPKMMIGGVALGLGSNDLPAGNDVLALLYFTGVEPGRVEIDSLSASEETRFALSPRCCDFFVPEFIGALISVELRETLPPVLLSNRSPIHGIILETLELSLEIVSRGLGSLTIASSSISLVDNTEVIPTVTPLSSIGETVDLLWAPGALDVGVWQYSVVVCDSLGRCATATAEFDIVADDEYLVNFEVKEHEVDFRWPGLTHGDLDQDGIPEIVVTGAALDNTSRLGIFKYTESNELVMIQEENDLALNAAPAIGMINGDDNLDLLIFGDQTGSNSLKKYARVFTSHGGPLLSLRDESLSVPFLPLDAKFADFSGDGRLDVVVVGGLKVLILNYQSNNRMNIYAQFTIIDTIKSINVADFDGDGDVDLAIGSISSLHLYSNEGQGVFIRTASYPQTYSAVNIEVTSRNGDFDEDGIVDLCVATPSVGGRESELILYTGDGVGGFDVEVVRVINGHVIGNCVGDFNGDTHLDVAYINASKEEVGLLLGTGLGAFDNELRYPIKGIPPKKIDCLDIDSDGDLDIVVVSSQLFFGGSMHTLENTLDPSNFNSVGVTITGLKNVSLNLRAPNGAMLTKVRNALPGSAMYLRDVDSDGRIDEVVKMSAAQRGVYTVSATANSRLSVGEPFSLEMNISGVNRRVAKDLPMIPDGYSFEIYPDGTSPHFPRNGEFVFGALPYFVVFGAEGFEFEIARDISFSESLFTTSVIGESFSSPISLANSDTAIYYWRYRTAGNGEWTKPIAVNALAVASPICGDVDGSRKVNVADIVYGIARLFDNGRPLLDLTEGDVDESGGFDVSDATYLIGYIFGRGPAPVCGSISP